MRQVTFEELEAIVKACKQYANWKAYKAFADQFYPGAVKLSVSTYGEYNDEGGTYYRVESVTAYDNAGNFIEDPIETMISFEEWRVKEVAKRTEQYNSGGWTTKRYSFEDWTSVDAGDYESAYHDERCGLPVEDDYAGEFTIVLVGDIPEMPRLYVEE